MIKIFEAFSGIGSQNQALKNLQLDYEVVAISDWDIGAIYAYDVLHNGPQDLAVFRHHTERSLLKELTKYSLSSDGKEPLTEKAIRSLSFSQMKAILYALKRTNNLTDITKVDAIDIPETDVLSYTFPCQDLSIAGHWHSNEGGIDKDADNRSTLLWEIERILEGYILIDKQRPKFLLMENVNNILSSKHIENFNLWQESLEKMGYVNQIYTLDARNFGVPQSRVRTYMISVLTHNDSEKNFVEKYFLENNLEGKNMQPDKINPLSEYLRLDYDDKVYRKEAIDSTPVFTPSREKIYKNNAILAVDDKVIENQFARTVTTKQDRNPNSGIIKYDNIQLTSKNSKYRNLTPRECFLLMGFDEEQYNVLQENNFHVNKNRLILPDSKIIHLSGNSIVVGVLEEIFRQINILNNKLKLVEG